MGIVRVGTAFARFHERFQAHQINRPLGAAMVHEFDRLLPTLVFEEDDDVLACLFEISEIGGFDMKVTELQPAKRVLWQVVDGPEEWADTKISFGLRR